LQLRVHHLSSRRELRRRRRGLHQEHLPHKTSRYAAYLVFPRSTGLLKYQAASTAGQRPPARSTSDLIMISGGAWTPEAGCDGRSPPKSAASCLGKQETWNPGSMLSGKEVGSTSHKTRPRRSKIHTPHHGKRC
jgi:hypothetical protein